MTDSDSKFVMDVIHGYIEISSTCVKIIDTRQFQRLRNIKQLGFVSFVYPSANHTRFEHCIGVSHLAKKMARHLLNSIVCKTLDNKSWIKCAEVAGLCHDIGHGPFSHDSERYSEKKVKHEKRSVNIFENMCTDYPKIGECINEEEREIVKAMILPEEYQHTIEQYPNEGFMFQIVSNDENGIDVDKMDYLTRDNFYLGQNKNFNYQQLISNAKVINVYGKQNICYPRKLKEHIYQIYFLRRWNFTHAYQHRVVSCISLMFEDAIKEAKKKKLEDAIKEAKKNDNFQLEDAIKEAKKNDNFQFEDAIKEAKKNDDFQLEDAIKEAKKNDNFQFNKMATDAIYYDLREKSELVQRIEERKLYNYLGGIPKNKLFSNVKNKDQADKDVKVIFLKEFEKVKDKPSYEELRACEISYKYGKTAESYFQNTYFYSKNAPNEAKALPTAEINALFTAPLADPTVYFFSTSKQKFDNLKKKIEEFISEENTAERMDH